MGRIRALTRTSHGTRVRGNAADRDQAGLPDGVPVPSLYPQRRRGARLRAGDVVGPRDLRGLRSTLARAGRGVRYAGPARPRRTLARRRLDDVVRDVLRLAVRVPRMRTDDRDGCERNRVRLGTPAANP